MLLGAYFDICSSHQLLAAAKNHTHTPRHDLSLPSLFGTAFLQGFETTQEITSRDCLLPQRGRNSLDEATARSFPRRDRGHFPARPELSQKPAKHLCLAPGSSVLSISFLRSSGHKFKHEKLHLNTRKNFTVRGTEHWNRLPRESWSLPL